MIYTTVPFLSHPVVKGVLRTGHPTEVGAVRLRRQGSGEGARRGAGGRRLAVARMETGRCLLQCGIGHSSQVHLLPGRSHI